MKTTTLTVRTNVVLILVWIGIILSVMVTNWPQPLIQMELAFSLGVATGMMQAHCLDGARDLFREAKSAWALRQLLASTLAGKTSIALGWITAAGALAWALLKDPDHLLVLWVPAYASFGLARELFALPAVIRLGASK